jgi:hypothetical protein
MTMEAANAPRPTSRRRRVVPAMLAVVTAAVSILAAGCGGGAGGAGVAQVATTPAATTPSETPSSTKASPQAFSACMRKNGVPNFPDPDSQGRIKVTSGIDRNGHQTGVPLNSPGFRRAQKACQKLQPGGKLNPQQQAKALETMLKFSACMRAHGVPKFPDPQTQGGGGIMMRIGKNMGVDPRSPQFQAAQKTCGKLFSGGPILGGGPRGATSAP